AAVPSKPPTPRAAIPLPDSRHDRGRSQRQLATIQQWSKPSASTLNRWIAERVSRAVAALEPDLMRPVSVREIHPKVFGERKSAAGIRVGHDFNPGHAVRVELVVPRRVKRVRPINPLAITADLNHLGASGKRLAVRMGRAAGDAAKVDRARELWFFWIGDVVLTHLAGSPAGDVQKPVVHR